MKQKSLFFIFAILLGLLALVTVMAYAQSTQPLAGSKPQEGPATTEYLILLPVPKAEAIQVPLGLTLDQARRFTIGLSLKQARPILSDLQRLQAQGSIASFELRPEQHAIAVQVSDPTALKPLSSLPGIAGITTAREGVSCAARAADALQEQVFGLSQRPSEGEARPGGIQTTDPSIDVYAPTGYDWSDIRIMTTPNTAVNLSIKRGGQVIASDTAVSSNNGYYYFYPDWSGGCGSGGYSWTLQPGDVVEVTAHGNTVSTVVAYLSAWVDPTANTVEGVTDPARSVDIQFYTPDASNPCTYKHFEQTVPAGGDGHFIYDFSGQVDFNGLADSEVYARDTNGNSTYAYYYAYHLSVEPADSYFGLYLKPSVNVTATLSRGGDVIETISGQTNARGGFWDNFTTDMQTGDVVAASGGGISISYTTTFLNVALDSVANQATGVTGAGRLVRGSFYKNRGWYYSSFSTSCSSSYSCAHTIADGSGAFTLVSSIDLVRGDEADFSIYDTWGNYQYHYLYVPTIVADLTWGGYVYGYWRGPGEYLTVVIKDSSNNLKDKNTDVWANSWDGWFDTYFYSSSFVPGDRIEVGNGVVTETMTVQNLTAMLNNNTEHLTGSASNGHLVSLLWDFRRDTGHWDFLCRDTSVTGGAYDLDFSTAQIGGEDEADIYSTGPDGHYTSRYAHAFNVAVEMDSGRVKGYTLSPGVPITATLLNNGTPVATRTDTSWLDGWYDVTFSTPLSTGQRVVVQADLSADITLPILTVNPDAVQNRLYGQSPASQPVMTTLDQKLVHYKGSWSSWGFDVWAWADAGGNYSASYQGIYVSYSGRCIYAQVGRVCTQPGVTYYRPDEYSISYFAPQPGVTADAYEPDNTPATAIPYTGRSSHTFHTISDIDWISVTVTTQDVGKTFYLDTVNLGPIADTVMALYATDGLTQLAYDDDGGGGFSSSITWIPSSPGVYYVKISPYGSSNAATCGATYDFFIAYSRTFLPIVDR